MTSVFPLSQRRSAVWLLGSACMAWACGAQEVPPAPAPVSQVPREPRIVVGQLVSLSGAPIPGARVELSGFHPRQPTLSTQTLADGTYRLEGAYNANAVLSLRHDNYYAEVVPVFLQGTEEVVSVPAVPLVRRQANRVRLWFAGDTMFGRRFTDRDEDGEEDEADDLIRPGSRADDTFALFRFLLPALGSADYRIANFESPASTAEASRHPFKRYSFTSHPETLAALPRAGIEAVSLGNNHSYDYLEPGRIETESALAAHGLQFFGSGPSERGARASALQVEKNGVPLAFQGFNGIRPINFWPDPDVEWPRELLYYAMDDPDKGGALLLSQSNMEDFLGREPSRFHVPILHGGAEYGEFPTEPMRDRFEGAHAAGARLVVAHHPHTVYGAALRGPPDDPQLTLLSLGNFIFDQEVFETFNSVMAQVDVDRTAEGQYRIVQARLIPFHQEDYVPSLTTGAQAQWMARHVAHISNLLPERAEDGLRGAVVLSDPAGMVVMLRDEDYAVQRWSRERFLPTLGESPLFELNRGAEPHDFFEGFDAAPAEVRIRLARDRLIFGDFEDYDVDDAIGENANFWQTETRYATSDVSASGRHSIALYREPGAETSINTQLRNRVTFDSDAELTLSCAFQGDNAGDVRVRAEYILRGERDTIGEQLLLRQEAGTYEWQRWSADLRPPSTAGHLRFVIEMEAPGGTGGTLFVDDCVLLEWGPELAPGQVLEGPHEYAWAKLVAGEATQISEQRVTYRRTLAP